MFKSILIVGTSAVLALVIIALGGYLWIDTRLDQFLDAGRTGTGWTLSYHERHFSPLDGRLVLVGATFRGALGRRNVVLDAGELDFGGIYPNLLGSRRFNAVRMRDVTETEADPEMIMRAHSLVLFGLDLAGPEGTQATASGDGLRSTRTDRIDGVEFSVTMDGAREQISAQSVEARNLHDGALTDLSLKGLAASITLPRGITRLSAARLSIDRVDLSRRFDGEYGSGASQDAEAAFAAMAGSQHAEFSDLNVSTPEGPAGMARMAVAAAVRAAGPHAFTETLNLTIDDLKVPGSAEALAALGYERLDASLDLSMGWDFARHSFSLDSARLAWPGAGSLTMMLGLEDLPSDALSAEDEWAAFTSTLLDQASLRSFSLAYEDQSLARRVEHLLAKRDGVGDEDYVAGLGATMEAFLAIDQNGNLQDAAREVRRFLEKPGRIALEFHPAAPVSFAQIDQVGLSSPLDLPQLLNLSVSAE